MKKIVALAGLIILTASIMPLAGYCQDKPEIHAKVWKYGTICQFADPPDSSGYDITATSDKVTLEVTDCKTFEKKNAGPAAVSVSLKNNGSSVAQVVVDKDLTAVEVITKAGQMVPAIAKRFLVEGPMGGKKMEFVTRIEASYLIKIKPGQNVNIVYLFPKAEAGDTVKVSTLPPVKIE
ncbi:MAG TPA: hypothetical protein VMG30_06380 [Acidobacteriota bacterium]|nr:hypothetical protein [Acidobacteriota bacterium]